MKESLKVCIYWELPGGLGASRPRCSQLGLRALTAMALVQPPVRKLGSLNHVTKNKTETLYTSDLIRNSVYGQDSQFQVTGIQLK